MLRTHNILDSLADLDFILKRQLKASSKLKKKSKRGRETVEDMIRKRTWPANGLKDLQKAVEDNIHWVENIISENVAVDKRVYDRILSMTVAAIYAFCPNGRLQALADLKESQMDELKSQAFVMSKMFKTQSKYGEQPIILDHPIVLRLIQIYKSMIRPKYPCGPEAPFFVTPTGKPYKIGAGVTAFFQRELGIRINITKIRSIVETEMHKLQLRGVITAEERASVMNINGHSSQVTKDYYLREDRLGDIRNGCAAFKKLAASPSNDATVVVCEEPTECAIVGYEMFEYDLLDCDTTKYCASSNNISNLSFEEEFGLNTEFFQPAVVVFGEKHPNQNCNAQRVAWSDAEVKIIGGWCKASLKLHPDWKSTIVARCLNFISSSDDARPYFHARHVEDSSRLRHGYELWLKQQEIATLV
jgi:hypothetical protein